MDSIMARSRFIASLRSRIPGSQVQWNCYAELNITVRLHPKPRVGHP